MHRLEKEFAGRLKFVYMSVDSANGATLFSSLGLVVVPAIAFRKPNGDIVFKDQGDYDYALLKKLMNKALAGTLV